MLEKALNLRFSLAVYICWLPFFNLIVLTRMSKFASLFAVCKRGCLTEVLFEFRCLFTFYFKLVFADNNFKFAILDLLTFCH